MLVESLLRRLQGLTGSSLGAQSGIQALERPDLRPQMAFQCAVAQAVLQKLRVEDSTPISVNSSRWSLD